MFVFAARHDAYKAREPRESKTSTLCAEMKTSFDRLRHTPVDVARWIDSLNIVAVRYAAMRYSRHHDV